MEKLYAEDLGHYWKTSRISTDDWVDKTLKLIHSHGGQLQGSYSGNDLASGRSALMISFRIAGDSFKIVWPVLPSRTKEDRAARVQAATLLYYDVKARLLSARILGYRTAFFLISCCLMDGLPRKWLRRSWAMRFPNFSQLNWPV